MRHVEEIAKFTLYLLRICENDAERDFALFYSK